jgi:hypothetical protein
VLRVSALEHAAIQSKMLLSFLNTPDASGYAEVLQTLRLCHQLHQLRKMAPAIYPKQETEAIGTFMRERESLLEALNQILRPFQFTPMLGGGNAAWERYSVDWRAVITSGSEARFDPRTRTIVIPAISAIKLALEMLANGMLDRIRQCRCGQWFFAASNKKTVCGDACRFHKFREKDSFKTHRAAYMREYRQNAAVRKRSKSKIKKAKRSRPKAHS